VQTADKI